MEINNTSTITIYDYKKYNTSLQIQKSFFYFNITFFLTLLSALRGGIGTDWKNYKIIFDTIHLKLSIIENVYPGLEKGYLLLNRIFSFFTGNYFILQFCVSIFTCYVIFNNLLKNTSTFFFILFIYYTSNYFGISFEIVRQSIATTIIILGLKFIEKRKIIFWSFIILLAMQFHVTAIVAFPLYFTTYCTISKRKAIILLIISLITSLFGNAFIRTSLIIMSKITILPSRLVRLLAIYLSSTSKHGVQIEFNSGFGFIVIYSIYTYILFMCYKGNNKSKNYFLLNFLIYILISSVGRNIQVINRCAIYYFISGNGIIAYSLILKKNNVFYKRLDFVRLFFVFLFMIFTTLTFIKGFNKKRPTGKSNAEYYIPYKTFLE